ncbi:MAG: hypothetical protein B6I35_05465 [Anaerolineaceae bacterium 4572_32.2]|nr:MAG: hypothetical protein B6I35_05465 [Anaerolineaceae bacterium 4572_32.2]
MTILVQWLLDYTWVLYPLCAIGFVIYVARALTAQRKRNRAQFTLERDIAAAQVVRAWAMGLVFVVIGAVVFASTTFLLPNLDLGPLSPTPTLEAGLEIATPTTTLAPSPTPGVLVPTFTPAAASGEVPIPPSPEPTETPAPESPDTPNVAVTGDVNVRLGDFARLVSYGLPANEVTAAQPLPLTLQWQALERVSTVDYWVFTHLLAEDDRLIGQHDGVPAGGTRPTTGWSSGEIIVDAHTMAFYDAAYTGPATIVVGM